jgi:hypothetical protein
MAINRQKKKPCMHPLVVESYKLTSSSLEHVVLEYPSVALDHTVHFHDNVIAIAWDTEFGS